jgi:hypothetical protein
MTNRTKNLLWGAFLLWGVGFMAVLIAGTFDH